MTVSYVVRVIGAVSISRGWCRRNLADLIVRRETGEK